MYASAVQQARAAWRTAWLSLPATPRLPERAAWLAQRQAFVLTRRQSRAAGITDAVLRSEVRAGRWSVPRRGVLSPLPRVPSASGGPHGFAPQVVAAAAALVRDGTSVSHTSAAQLCCLPVLDRPERPLLTAASAARVAGRADALVHCVPIAPGERARWYGVSATSVARTIVDVARTDGVAAGLVVADAALAELLVEPEQLRVSLAAAAGRRGVAFARRVVELADPRAESPLESLARLCLIDGGISPEPQQWLDTDRGWFRVDLLVDSRVVVEGDGLLKYRSDDAHDNPLVREKLRQEAIERAGYAVVRVGWSDVRSRPAEIVCRVRDALVRTSRPGSVRPDFGRESGRTEPGQQETWFTGSW